MHYGIKGVWDICAQGRASIGLEYKGRSDTSAEEKSFGNTGKAGVGDRKSSLSTHRSIIMIWNCVYSACRKRAWIRGLRYAQSDGDMAVGNPTVSNSIRQLEYQLALLKGLIYSID